MYGIPTYYVAETTSVLHKQITTSWDSLLNKS